MKKLLAIIILMASSTCALARNDISDYSVEEAMSTPKLSSAIGEGVSFYFGEQKYPKVLQNFGEFGSNKKTNAFGKSDKAACQWAFASAIKSLKQRAEKEGGNAVINIRSNYKGNVTASDTTFKCGAGAIVAGVALVGDVVKIEG
ncbi:excinuclease ABC subunit A [Microbulbifer variabilis]|uniref:excinuclease ABC subunit A n=1 Tax=Microbulbifer variabilis TaxID=266805 RepID=UPI001CFE1FF9|nr:excinuclease ABC subunit A [Microbulbifer variabilis]